MSFRPKDADKPSGNDFSNMNFPVPKAGSRLATISLLVDMGTQNRPGVYKLDDKIVNEDTEGAELYQPPPCQQIAVFADLPRDLVDYGGDIGKAYYRLMLNKSFAGVISGINFTSLFPVDAKGKKIPGKARTFHPKNLFAILSKATCTPEVMKTLDITELLGKSFMATVEVSEKDSGKEDKDGNAIIYRNVNYRGASQVAMVSKDTGEVDGDGEPIVVEELPVIPALKVTPKCITFDNATKEDILLIRQGLLKQIKEASNYPNSQMEKAVKEFEAEAGIKEDKPKDAAPAKAASKAADKPKAASKPKEVPQEEADDAGIPF